MNRYIKDDSGDAPAPERIPVWVSVIHLTFLGSVVAFAHHSVIFMGQFMFFIGFTKAYEQYQNPLILKEGLLVGFFLAGLMVLGGGWNSGGCSRLSPARD